MSISEDSLTVTQEDNDYLNISRADAQSESAHSHPPPSSTSTLKKLRKGVTSVFKGSSKGKSAEVSPEPAKKPKPKPHLAIKNIWKQKKGKGNDDRDRKLQQALVEHAREEEPSKEDIGGVTEVVLELCKDDMTTTPLQDATAIPTGNYSYAQKVPTPSYPPPTSLPPPSTVFETLLKSNGQQQSHGNHVSSLMHAIGVIIALSVVRTNANNCKINETSPYLDLAPLYGLTAGDSEDLREIDGTGFLAPDCYFEDNIMLTNSAAALLILLNRNHNYIAKRLLEKNEKGWKSIDELENDDKMKEQDDTIFELARRINCIHFKNIICQDYLKGLLGIPQVGAGMNIDFLRNASPKNPSQFHTSVESALLYNLQSLLSDRDVNLLEKKLHDVYRKSPSEITADDLQSVSFPRGQDTSKRRKDCAGLRRGRDFRFTDAEIANVLYAATEHVAGAARPNNVAACFRAWQVQLMENARREWRVCTFNQYRSALGLRPLKSFEEWNSDERVASAAKQLYHDINALELYPGLQAEERAPGDGFALGYTWGHGMSTDLISRIRNDPELTIKATRDGLTDWGYEECVAPTWNNGAFSAMLPRLLQRNLPQYYPYQNIYSLFPLLVPAKAKEELQKYDPKATSMYKFERPTKTTAAQSEGILVSRESIKQVFKNSTDFASPYDDDLRVLTQGYGYFLGFDNPELHNKDRLLMMYSLLPDSGAASRHVAYYQRSFDDILKDKIKNNQTRDATVDIVEIINTTCTRWVQDNLFGHGEFTKGKKELDIFHDLESLYGFVLGHGDPEDRWKMRHHAIKISGSLRRHILEELPIPHDYDRFPPWWQELYSDFMTWYQSKLLELGLNGRRIEVGVQTFLSRVFRYSSNFSLGNLIEETPHLQELRNRLYEERKNAHQFATNLSERTLRRAIDSDVDADFERERMVANILGLIIVSSVKVAYASTAVTAFYLRPGMERYRDEIKRLASKPNLNDEDKKLLRGYIWEAQRLAQPLVLRRVAKTNTVVDNVGNSKLSVMAGSMVLADLRYEQADPTINPTRSQHGLYGFGLHKCPAMGNQDKFNFADEVLCGIIQSVFQLNEIELDGPPTLPVASGTRSSRPPTSLRVKFKLDTENDGSKQENNSVSVKRQQWGKSHQAFRRGFRPVLNYAPREFGILLGFVIMILWVVSWILSMLGMVVLMMTPSSVLSVFYVFKIIPATIYLVYYVVSAIVSSPWTILMLVLRILSAFIPDGPRVAVVIQAQHVDCPQPITQLTPMEFTGFNLSMDGKPISVVYSTDHSTAHRVSVIDVDKLDTKIAILIDGIGRGSTRDFELDKSRDCGDDYYKCFTDGWSAGMVTVPPGRHTIEIRYDGKEYIGNTSRVDWGGETTRRFVWWKELCGPQ